MFENWSFLLVELWTLLVLAAALGLFVGWIIWGGKATTVEVENYNQDTNSGKPKSLDKPKAGGADDLTRIIGIGPKLAKLCNSLGYYHFDQIASWTPSEVAWVDENLEGFKGRVTRDRWVEQAKALVKS